MKVMPVKPRRACMRREGVQGVKAAPSALCVVSPAGGNLARGWHGIMNVVNALVVMIRCVLEWACRGGRHSLNLAWPSVDNRCRAATGCFYPPT